jgi:hypothetical protein
MRDSIHNRREDGLHDHNFHDLDPHDERLFFRNDTTSFSEVGSREYNRVNNPHSAGEVDSDVNSDNGDNHHLPSDVHSHWHPLPRGKERGFIKVPTQ